MPTSSPASRPRRSADLAVSERQDTCAGRRHPLIHAALVAAALVLAGCSALPSNAVPVELMGVATLIPDVPGARAPAGAPDAAIQQDLARSFEQESATEFPIGPDGIVHYAHLALSGGGANGAFGAGYNWITIPEDVELSGNELFDPVTMGKLFELGRQRAQAASPWFTDPPGLRWDSAP